jgi:hypothetical protein
MRPASPLTTEDDAANLVVQACSGHAPTLDSSQCPAGYHGTIVVFGSTVELLLNARECSAIVQPERGASFPDENDGRTRRTQGSWLVRSY